MHTQVSERSVLVIGNSGEYEVAAYNATKEFLVKKGYTTHLFKQDKCLNGEYLSFRNVDGAIGPALRIDGDWYDAKRFDAIWYLKPHLPYPMLRHPDTDCRIHMERQFHAMRRLLWCTLREKTWLNDPLKQDEAENKPYQMLMAHKAGLKMPETVITSCAEEAAEFDRKHPEGVVVKMLAASPMLDKVIYTNRLDDGGRKRFDTLKLSPCIFQALVPKAYEMRITVVGEKFFGARIHSQEDVATALDWRVRPVLNDYKVRMESCEVSESLKSKLKALMRLLGLRFGCIDVIVTPDGEEVFLEINPNGQWYFVQVNAGLDIAEAIADVLTS